MQKLTKAEEQIMQMIWDTGPTTVSELISRMEGSKPPHSSISSIFRILEKKGFLDHKAYGRTYEYYPVIDKKDYSKHSLRRFVRGYFEGSMKELVSFLVREDDLTLEDLKKISEQLDKNDNK